MKLFLWSFLILEIIYSIKSQTLKDHMKWVTMWGNAQSIVMPSPTKYAKDLTLRYPIFVPFDGNKIRITLDNYVIDEQIKIDYIVVSKGKKLSDEQINNWKYLTFKGKREAIIEPHGYIISD